jgi:hypothetical protein
MATHKKPRETGPGGYCALPYCVLDGAAYRGLSHPARSLLIEVLRQHNGSNNGKMQLATKYLRARGWSSADVVDRAKKELVESGLAIKTRLGGLNAGPDLWALTWMPIANFSGLTEVSSASYQPGKWRLADPMPTIGKHVAPSVSRNSTDPSNGTANSSTDPSNGTKKGIFGGSTVPSHGNNVFMPVHGVKKRVVGKSRQPPEATPPSAGELVELPDTTPPRPPLRPSHSRGLEND